LAKRTAFARQGYGGLPSLFVGDDSNLAALAAIAG
jgi:hypothetical protein